MPESLPAIDLSDVPIAAPINEVARVIAKPYFAGSAIEDSLDTICDQYYDFLGDYMTHIYSLTTEAIKNDPQDEVTPPRGEFAESRRRHLEVRQRRRGASARPRPRGAGNRSPSSARAGPRRPVHGC